jgi:FkbM family methyltransferase
VQQRLGVSIRREPLFGSLDWELRRLIDLHSIDLVLDVGANQGQFVNRLRTRIGYHGTVVSFEPGPIGHEAESASVNDDGWIVHGVAVGAEDGTTTLYVAVGDDLSSLHQPLDSAAAHFPTIVTQSEIDVPIRRLDTMWGELSDGRRPVLLKSDTQGHELDVIAGCGDRMDEVAVVLVEASSVQLYADQTPIETTIEVMRRLGLFLCAAFPVSRRMGVAVEFDCLFARPIEAP